jgi:hypothetical protein
LLKSISRSTDRRNLQLQNTASMLDMRLISTSQC